MDISKITDYLYVGTQPNVPDYNLLRDLKIHLVINMRGQHPPHFDLGNPPIKTIWIKTYDSILRPVSVELLKQGVDASLLMIQENKKVFVHCAVGKHRSVAMATAILIAKGYSADQAMDMIKAQRPVADPRAWHVIRKIRKFEEYWNNLS